MKKITLLSLNLNLNLFLNLCLCLCLVSAASCKSGTKKSAETSEPAAIKQFELVEAWRTDTLLLTPESVILDRKRDILYVSNLNFEPRKKDGNGFISKIDKTGKITELQWIEGLSSPKGMAIVADTLFAADVDEVVVMDIPAGKIIRKIPIAGAGMLNDITSDNEGNLYISDTDANKIHKYSGGKITEWLTEGLNGPNGLLWDGERLLVASQGGQDFPSCSKNKRQQYRRCGIHSGIESAARSDIL